MTILYPSNLLKEIILEAQEEDLAPLNERTLEVPLDSKKPIIIAGMRRTGKSSYLSLIQQKLIREKGLARYQICYVNFVDERLRPLRKELLSELEQAYFELYPDATRSLSYCFFDEIQLVPDWEFFIERLARKRGNRIFISGSSAQFSSSQIASALRGRPLVYELFPYSLSEVYRIRELSTKKVSSRLKAKLLGTADQYLYAGGFPETFEMPKNLRLQTHSEYYRALLVRDLIERHNPRNSHVVEVVLKELTRQVGLLTSLNRTKNRLKAIGIRVSLSQLTEYLSWAEQSYYLYRTELYTESEQKRRVNPIKLYAIDSGLINSVSASLSNNAGRLFENMLFSHLRRHYDDIFHYKTRKGYEIDFVIPKGRKEVIIQACYDLSDNETRFRELRALDAAMDELNNKKAYLITSRTEEQLSTANREIFIVPAWKFLAEIETRTLP